MSEKFVVQLSEQSAPSHWGENASLSFNEHGATVHLSEQETLKNVQKAARTIATQGVKAVELTGDTWCTESQWAFYQGFVTPKSLNGVTFVDNAQSDIKELGNLKTSAIWAREMVNGTADDIYPESLAEKAAEFIQSLAPEHVSYQIIKGDALLEQQWIGIHAVGRGSVRPPVLLELDYNPTGDANAPVSAALVGKGITFDSGGYSIKSSEGMLGMKCDMGGAATVTAGLALAINRGIEKRIKLFLCCAENLISGHAYKLGDILTYKNGTTVEIVNTDAEGRLVLADGLMAAGESGAPLIIDAATLTGAALVAVGQEYNALFALDKELVREVEDFASQEMEAAWPLPLEKWHQQNCPSAYADTANSRAQKGGGYGGASNAAGFLSRFVANDGKGWVHIDLAAAFNMSSTNQWAAGATTQGMRTVARTLLEKA
ncbi:MULTISPECIES: aminopeptidase PepB [Pseudoalteromonas]|jgi:PepB aminopeptidase|uniref:Aminopeptidase B, a cysteinylglycinase n=3 Tax=Pseudoalteromonas TaxID=53246 RepID=Q3ILK4_PSET1|nr:MULTISPECIES: aminopeptidase PepB [Pseudoalteromonas]ASM53006.1 PepB aminopeptidase [Pseudoalteromonas nigrifaciens]MBB1405397.1 aminopeptidase PepB [Pseudoalteromonas sp. SG44-5]MBE0420252.1 aminopeptidase PepB [Pseudoalteromonas nigrifaciens]MBH0071775.1 aminopeptidase PepB [Pseudoalteromonas sp. NZS127]MBH0092434.1 aminopeptidase PepB [Pseudoalteromonas sp. SCQQ13]|tara:strand:+ start:2001 stop:3296 length:1296 start_codon:yes stop_codon:yes gene_type:complete